MFEKGSYVVYGNSGICKVEDITHIDIPDSDSKRMYYVLTSVTNKGNRSFIPVDNVKVVIRNIINKDEAMELIDNIPEIEEIWIDNDKAREEKYKEYSRTCDCRNWVSIIKTIYLRKEQRIEQGKKMTSTDERYFRIAEDNLYSELGFALNKDKSEMEDFIASRIKEA